jgi:hypothetical protein
VLVVVIVVAVAVAVVVDVVVVVVDQELEYRETMTMDFVELQLATIELEALEMDSEMVGCCFVLLEMVKMKIDCSEQERMGSEELLDGCELHPMEMD